MTSHEFTHDPKKRELLRTILSTAVFQEALAIARKPFEARTGDADSSPVLAASRYQQQAGVNALLDSLHTLCEEPKAKKPVTTKALATSVEDLPK